MIAGTSVLVPDSVEALAAMLRQADREGAVLAPRGGGTKWTWGSVPARIDAVLSTERLNTAVDHCAGDLTATIAAGATLREVNALLARAGQWLPLDPPAGDRATIGGIIATNDSGPQRQKHGTPRDLILGVEMVRADGRVAKAGGRVVKNVSGYDLGRMMCGSLGTLAVVTQATFKLAPIAAASRTVIADGGDIRAISRLARAVASAPLAPSAIEVQVPANRLLVRFDSTEGAADRQASTVQELCRAGATPSAVLAGVAEAQAWQEHERLVWNDRADTLVMKVSVLPTDVGAFFEYGARVAAERSMQLSAVGRAALGVLYVRLENPSEGPAKAAPHMKEVLDALRAYVITQKGTAVIVSGPEAVRMQVDPWGDFGSGRPVMRAVKARFDPRGTLCDRFGF